jgi:hypothetical protein
VNVRAFGPENFISEEVTTKQKQGKIAPHPAQNAAAIASRIPFLCLIPKALLVVQAAKEVPHPDN